MKILHLSDVGLPDWRIEKSAITALKLDHTVFFAGMKSVSNNRQIFSKLYEVNWTPRARRGFPFYWHCVKKQMNQIIKELKPDIVHAHNIFSAKMISEFSIPFVYDDHEYWPSYVKRQVESSNSSSNDKNAISKNSLNICTPRRLARRLAHSLLNHNSMRLGLKWEKELVRSTPTITVSDRIAKELEGLGCTRIFVTPNFPMRNEMDMTSEPPFHDHFSSVYVGVEPKGGMKISHRNLQGLVEVFCKEDIGTLTMIGVENKSSAKIKYKGFLPRQEMYAEMLNHSIGLIPFKKHWSHPLISPNKAYEYAHAGLLVMCSSSFETVRAILRDHCVTFEDFDDMVLQIKHMKENMGEVYDRRQKIFDFARTNLVWENYEKNILRAYDSC